MIKPSQKCHQWVEQISLFKMIYNPFLGNFLRRSEYQWLQGLFKLNLTLIIINL